MSLALLHEGLYGVSPFLTHESGSVCAGGGGEAVCLVALTEPCPKKRKILQHNGAENRRAPLKRALLK